MSRSVNVSKSGFTPDCAECRWVAWDPDGNYCGHAESFKQTIFGRGLRAMRDPNTSGDDAICGMDGKLFEERETNAAG